MYTYNVLKDRDPINKYTDEKHWQEEFYCMPMDDKGRWNRVKNDLIQ